MSYTLNPDQLSRTKNYLSIGDQLFGFGQSGVWAAIRKWGQALQAMGSQLESLAPPSGSQPPTTQTPSTAPTGTGSAPQTPSAPPVTTGGQAPGPTGIPTVGGGGMVSPKPGMGTLEILVPVIGSKIPVNKTPFTPPKL